MHYPLNYNHSINKSKQDRVVTKIGTFSLPEATTGGVQ